MPPARWLPAPGQLPPQQQRTFGDLVAHLDLDFLDHAGLRRRNLHRRLVRFHGDQRLVHLDRVADLDHQLDDLDFLEITDIRDFDFHNAHSVCSVFSLLGHRIRLVRIQAVLDHRLLDDGQVDLAFFGQRTQGRDGDVVTVHLEELAQLGAAVGAAETVGAQHAVGAVLRHEGADLLCIQAHVVGGGDDRALRVLEQARHVWHALFLGRVDQVPAFGVLAVAGDQGQRRRGPDVGGNAPVFFQQFGGEDGLAQDGARTDQLHALAGVGGALLQQVHALQDALFLAFLQARVRVVLVHDGDVVEHVFLFRHHAAQAVMNDDRQLVAEGRVVRQAVRDGGGEQVAVAVLVLQAFAVQGRAAGGAAHHEAACAHVAGGPGQVAHALHAEHRVVREEWDHHAVIGRVRRGRGDPRAHAARFVDALLQDLAGLVLAVVHHLVLVDRLVQLALLVEDADLAEQAFHAEGTRFVDQDRHDALAQALVAQQRRDDPHKTLRGRDLAAFRGRVQHGLERFQRWHHQRLVGLHAAVRQVAAQGLAALVQVLHFRRVVGRLEERDLGQLVIRNWDVEAVAHFADGFVVELLGLVRRVARLARLAHAVALDGLHQQHGRLALRFLRDLEGGVDFVRVVAAARQAPDVVVAHVGDHFQQLRMLAEEVLAHVGAVLGLVVLVFAVDGFHHDALQNAVLVLGQQLVPARAPDDFHDIPAGAAEFAFQFLDDLAVAAHGAVQALQVAVDDDDEVVQLLARGHADGAQRFRLVHLAVAAEGPHLAAVRVGDAARVQVLQEARLVDRHQRAQAHRHGGELPEFRHQFRVRVRGQALAVHFLAEVDQLFFRQAAFQEGARVDAGRRVARDVQQVAAVVFGRGAPEVVEADAQHVRQRGERGQVATQVAVGAVGPDHHRHRVPAHPRAQTLFVFQVAGTVGADVGGDGVDVGGVGGERDLGAAAAGQVDQALHQVVGAFGAFVFKDGFQRLQPFLGFQCVRIVGGLGRDLVKLS